MNQQFNQSTYNNVGYNYIRRKKQSLILDVEFSNSGGINNISRVDNTVMRLTGSINITTDASTGVLSGLTDLSSTNDHYNNMRISLNGGITGTITDYNGEQKEATITWDSDSPSLNDHPCTIGFNDIDIIINEYSKYLTVDHYHTKHIKGSEIKLSFKISNLGNPIIKIINSGNNYHIGDILTIDSSLWGNGISFATNIELKVTGTDDLKNNGIDFSVDLYEPLHIDTLSTVFLDNFITYNCNLGDNEYDSAACLSINEFNINTNVATNDNRNKGEHMFNKIIIPNENNNIANFHTVISHKAKKFNYVCELNPSTITKLTGKITNMNGNSFFNSFDHNVIYSISFNIGPTTDIHKYTNFYIITGLDMAQDPPTLTANSEIILCTSVTHINSGGQFIYFVTDADEHTLSTLVDDKDDVLIHFASTPPAASPNRVIIDVGQSATSHSDPNGVSNYTIGRQLNTNIDTHETHVFLAGDPITIKCNSNNICRIRSDYGRFIAEFTIDTNV